MGFGGYLKSRPGTTFSFYRLPIEHDRHLKSSNVLERLNQELLIAFSLVPRPSTREKPPRFGCGLVSRYSGRQTSQATIREDP
jgi:hypothetical protein